jgi:predicted GNAT superfamily acetyltransferase
MSGPITYRAVTDIAELDAVTRLEMDVWHMDGRSAVPSNIMSAIIHQGGHVNAAFDGDTMVGMALALPAYREGRVYLWSHMAGVLPGWQSRNIGVRLKQEQRAWASAYGYREIRWTFDPLQRGNANFNFNRLRVTADTYHINIYGVMEDGINRGLPSDRLEAVWPVDDAPHSRVPDTPQPALLLSAEEPPCFTPGLLDTDAIAVALPHSFSSPDAKLRWRYALREAFTAAFARGFHVVGFRDAAPFSLYQLARVR